MLTYNSNLKPLSRQLRRHMTDSEQWLWSRLRRKQILGVQFYRQKPIGNYIADFYAPKAKLVIELDGSQHFEDQHLLADKTRDIFLREQGLEVLRFDNLQVLEEFDAVLEVIFCTINNRTRK